MKAAAIVQMVKRAVWSDRRLVGGSCIIKAWDFLKEEV